MINIIIVEDELISAEYLKEILMNNNCNILAIIDNGKEAIETIPKLNPDIVFMDIMLKDKISGNEVSVYLRQFTPDIAIIFLTAYADKKVTKSVKEVNLYAYLMKPYNEKEIVATLEIINAKVQSRTPLR